MIIFQVVWLIFFSSSESGSWLYAYSVTSYGDMCVTKLKHLSVSSGEGFGAVDLIRGGGAGGVFGGTVAC